MLIVALFVQDFAWSPTDSIMCAYQSEQAGGNLPARLSLIKLPERQELRQKNLFSVSGESPCAAALHEKDSHRLLGWLAGFVAEV